MSIFEKSHLYLTSIKIIGLQTSLVESNYNGWALLECHTNLLGKLKPMKEQRAVFDQMIAKT